MTTSSLTIWLDADLKRGAAEVADYYGLDLSSVTRAFYKQMVNTRRILLTFAPRGAERGEPCGNCRGERVSCIRSWGRYTNGCDLIEAAMA